MIALTGLLPEEILSTIPNAPKFTAKQIFKWIAKGVTSFDQMTNISLDLRKQLSENTCLYTSKVNAVLKDPDGTIKVQTQLQDGNMIETVLLIDSDGRKTACVSCQAGCGMGCIFCKTGTLGLSRNLTAAEIVEQFLYLEQHSGTLQNIVFMGMGEPLQNLTAIRKTLSILSHKDGRNLSLRRVTISTCGIIPAIYDLADNGPLVKLAISLTVADANKRKRIMPIAKGNDLNELHKAIAYYTEKTGKRCTLEVPLLGEDNTTLDDAKKLVKFAKPLHAHVNLIPWNPVEGLDCIEPTKREIDYFSKQLENGGVNITLRQKRGRAIGGACGQLGKTT